MNFYTTWLPVLVTWIVVFHVVVLQHPRAIIVKSCSCGAHWWVRKWGFWRHLDASPFNDQLQNQWTIWLLEFRKHLKLSTAEQRAMGYPLGPVWEDGRPMWSKSKWQLSIYSVPYCLRCMLHS